jgi:cysteine synthase/rhodanese-related sulfurtransferase
MNPDNHDHALRVYDSIMGLLPNEENPTPLVRLNRTVPFKHAQVYAKLEWYNPFGAIKDRVAANMIDDAERRDALAPGQKMVEATSGNTGLGLAMVGNLKGYPLRTPLSAAIPQEKKTTLRVFGSDVHELDDSLCPAPGAPEGAIAAARQTAESEPDFVALDQYTNSANPESHYKTTGPEIWRQTQGRVTHFVAGLGTCGTITGTGRFLKEKNSDITVLGAHPEEGHDIPGVRSLVQLQQTDFFRPDEYDGITEIPDRDAFNLCLRLNREEGIVAGPSSGMALAGALRLVPDKPGVVAVVIFPDSAFKYASSFERHFPEIRPAAPKGESSGPSKDDLFVAEMIENLKNPHDSARPDDVAKRLNGQDSPLLVDIRPPDMYAKNHIAGAVNIPEDDLAERSGELPEERESEIVMVCGIGKFSKRTTLYLKSMGYRNVRSMKGGINEWVRKGHPTTSNSAGVGQT